MVANRKRGEVLLEIGGEVRTLRLDFNGICTLEQMHGGTPVHVLVHGSRLGMTVIRDALFVAIVAGDPRRARVQKITPEKVGEWLSEEKDRLNDIVETLSEVLQAAMPGGDEDPKSPATPAAAPADHESEDRQARQTPAASTTTTSGS